MSTNLEIAKRQFEEFDAKEYAAEIILLMPLEEMKDMEKMYRHVDFLVKERQLFLEARYRSALKKEMAKREDEDWWQKI